MKKLISWMNDKLAPSLNKITQNAWVSSISDSFVLVLPLILIGTLITIISTIRTYVPAIPDFQSTSNFSFGLMGIFVAFLVPYHVLEKKKIENGKVLAALLSVSLYFMLTRFTISAEGIASFEFARLGSGGIFVALFTGIFTSLVMSFFLKKAFFSRNDNIPAFVTTWFDSLLPITIVLLTGWLITEVFKGDAFVIINILVSPLVASAQSFPGFVLLSFLMAFFYAFGVSTWWAMPIIYAVGLPALAANAALVAQGLAPTNISTMETWTAWIWIGGTGVTLPLVFMMLFSKSKTIKILGRASIVPSLMNINEPIVFGLPIAFNPILMIPLWINGILVPVITYLTLSAGWVTIPFKSFLLWFMPVGISSYLVNGDWRGLILLAVLLTFSSIVWYPFFKIYERQLIKKESIKE